ncbi:alpha/beta hydrolase [Qipengyuania nanhaisediminis]|uniref:alpha/beta hydrolase n=1 Tax=Qipengyuania nanhaisediminis TaxID=604088 RepID=UPI0038B2F1AC
MWWILGAAVLILLGAALYLGSTLSRNGPVLLSALDRVAGGSGGAKPLARIATGEHGSQRLHVWGPDTTHAKSEKRPVIVFVHGGGWRSGDPDGYGFVGRAFVPEGFVVVNAGYRLGKDGAYPAMLEDTASAIAWTHENIAEYGGDPDRIVLAGHSAGAYNVVQVALEDRWLAAHGLSGVDIAGVIGLAGPYDFAPFDSDSTIAAFGHSDDPPATQPINHVRADAPPMLLVNGQEDTLVGARNARVLASALTEAGAEARTVLPAGMGHNGPIIALAAPWRDRGALFGTMVDFARAVTDPGARAGERAGALSVPVQAETR